jgi:hypothetical protein
MGKDHSFAALHHTVPLPAVGRGVSVGRGSWSSSSSAAHSAHFRTCFLFYCFLLSFYLFSFESTLGGDLCSSAVAFLRCIDALGRRDSDEMERAPIYNQGGHAFLRMPPRRVKNILLQRMPTPSTSEDQTKLMRMRHQNYHYYILKIMK